MCDENAYNDLLAENAKLVNELRMYKAASNANLWSALKDARSLANKDFKASAVIINITAIDGKQLIGDVAIKDGLSRNTIISLIKDIERTIEDTKDFLNL